MQVICHVLRSKGSEVSLLQCLGHGNGDKIFYRNEQVHVSIGGARVQWTFLPYCVDPSRLSIRRFSKEKDKGLTLAKHQKSSDSAFSLHGVDH